MNVRPLGTGFAAEITHLQLTEQTVLDRREDLYRTYLEHKVIVLRNQRINTEIFAAFGTIFGRPEVHHVRAMRHPDIPTLTMLSNSPSPDETMS